MPCCAFILQKVERKAEKAEQKQNLLKLELFHAIADFFEVDRKEVIIEY